MLAIEGPPSGSDIRVGTPHLVSCSFAESKMGQICQITPLDRQTSAIVASIDHHQARSLILRGRLRPLCTPVGGSESWKHPNLDLEHGYSIEAEITVTAIYLTDPINSNSAFNQIAKLATMQQNDAPRVSVNPREQLFSRKFRHLPVLAFKFLAYLLRILDLIKMSP